MDTDFLNDVKKYAPLNQPRVDLEEVQHCPKCNSFYIENEVCQTCHFNLGYDLLGEPLGERSFYTLRENYWASLTTLERENIRFFKDEGKHKRYLNKVKLRYNDLLDFFYTDNSVHDENRALFLHELRDVVLNLMEEGISEDEIWRPLNEKDMNLSIHHQSLFERIKEVVNEQKAINKVQRRQGLLQYRFAGRFTLSTILIVSMFVVLFISLSLAYLSYRQFMV